MANQQSTEFDTQVLTATGAASIEAAWESLANEYDSNNPKDFSAATITNLKAAGLDDDDIAGIIAYIVNYDEGEGQGEGQGEGEGEGEGEGQGEG